MFGNITLAAVIRMSRLRSSFYLRVSKLPNSTCRRLRFEAEKLEVVFLSVAVERQPLFKGEKIS